MTAPQLEMAAARFSHTSLFLELPPEQMARCSSFEGASNAELAFAAHLLSLKLTAVAESYLEYAQRLKRPL